MRYLLVLSTMLLVGSCGHDHHRVREVKLSEEDLQQIADLPKLTAEQGHSLLSTHCYSCHSPKSGSHDDMLAPPLAGIKNRYQMSFPERAVFVHQFAQFVAQPSEEKAVMRGPVRRFGLMPPTTLSKDSIWALAAYVYDNELPVPNWFPEHFEEKHGASWRDN